MIYNSNCMKRILKSLFYSGLLSSLIIGAGMFSLPFIFAQTGFALGAVILSFFVLVSIVIHVRYTKIVQKDDDDKMFGTFVKKYLGSSWKTPAMVIVLTGMIFSLLVYLVLSASFIKLIVPGINSGAAVFLFWIIGSVFIFMGMTKYAIVDFLAFLGIVGIIFFIFISGIGFGGNIRFNDFSVSSIGLVFGPFLFSLYGRSAISSLWDKFNNTDKSKSLFIKSVVLGTVIPAICYILFVHGVLRLSSNGVSTDAVSGITLLPFSANLIIGVLGFLALITSYIFLGLETKGILKNDFKVPSGVAAIAVALLPLGIYLLGFTDFMKLISLGGGVFLSIESILVVLIYRKAYRKNNFTDAFLILIFATAIILEIINIFR